MQHYRFAKHDSAGLPQPAHCIAQGAAKVTIDAPRKEWTKPELELLGKIEDVASSDAAGISENKNHS